MPVSKKPRRAYHAKPVVRPLNLRNPWMTEGDVHAALLAMESRQVTSDHLASLAAHADILRRVHRSGPVAVQAQTILRMIGLIMRRPEPDIRAAEEVAIRAAVQVTMPALRALRNHDILRAAESSMRDHNRFGGVPLGPLEPRP